MRVTCTLLLTKALLRDFVLAWLRRTDVAVADVRLVHSAIETNEA